MCNVISVHFKQKYILYFNVKVNRDEWWGVGDGEKHLRMLYATIWPKTTDRSIQQTKMLQREAPPFAL